jgi:YbbR domain-containing protein
MHGTGVRRELKIKVGINYVGIPNNVRFDSELPSSLSLVFKDEGKELWSYFGNDEFDSIQIDLSSAFDGSGVLDMPIDYVLTRINTRLAQSTQIVDAQPSSIHAEYSVLHKKTVPFVLRDEIRLAHQYVLSDSIMVNPSNVTVYAEQSVLDTITEIILEVPNTEISKSGKMSLKPSSMYESLSLQPAVADILVNVEIATEKSVSILVNAINLPENISFRAFPNEVKITFLVGISRFNSVNADDFSVAVDYNNLLLDNRDGNVRLSLLRVPPFVYNTRIYPSDIEYILLEED